MNIVENVKIRELLETGEDNSRLLASLLFTEGLIVFNLPEVLEIVDIGDFEYIVDMSHPDKLNEMVLMSRRETSVLQKVETYFEDTFMSLFKYRLNALETWRNSDPGTLIWHNDSTEGDINLTAIIYLTDHDKDTGGAIMMKRSNGDGECLYYPKRGTVALINQKKEYLHKTTESTNDRVVISLDYTVDLLL